MPFRRPLLAATCAASFALAFAACDSAPGPDALVARAPEVSDLTFTPQAFGAADVTDDGVARTTVTLSVRAEDADGDLLAVRYLVRSPRLGREASASGTLTRTGDGTYGGTFELAVPAGEVGAYVLRVYAEDAAGRLSNAALGTIRLDIPGGPPVLTALDISPNPFVPGPGREIRLVATVDDPEGLGNIARVEAILTGDGAFDLADDGRSLGDETAGDGRYTSAFEVEELPEGTYTFTAFATDFAGNRSDSLAVDLVVE